MAAAVKNLSRRDLFKSVAGLSGGLLLGVYLPGFSRIRKLEEAEGWNAISDLRSRGGS